MMFKVALQMFLFLLSFIVAAEIWSWNAAVLITISLITHEVGHLLAMKHYSLKIRGVVFVPVLGAAVVSQEVFPSKKVETIVAACGPLFGLCNATLILGLWVVTQVPLLFAIATFTMSLNLFNLIPLPILDGGIIAKNLFWTGEQPLGLRKLGAVLYVFGFSVIIEGFIFMPQLDRLVLGCSEAWKLFW